jgi:hypothetical protein
MEGKQTVPGDDVCSRLYYQVRGNLWTLPDEPLEEVPVLLRGTHRASFLRCGDGRRRTRDGDDDYERRPIPLSGRSLLLFDIYH